tara:strand:+ start:127 stop:936 length:810 start_codon:yes stop_codon:yes gene_type:complete
VVEKLGVIGFGNIAKAIITPLLDNGFLKPEQIHCLVRSEKSFESIKESYKYKVNLYHMNSSDSFEAWQCPVKLLCVKPQHLNNLNEINFESPNNILVSILAGVSIEKLEKRFPTNKCVRIVTNIPIKIGKGLTGIAWGKGINTEQINFIKEIFENSSKIYELNEDYLDVFLALTSSAPAIIALIVEALSDGGLSGGLQKKLSEELVLEMILGTILLLKDFNISTTELKNMVTSPGGTTISALRVLERRSFRSALIESIVAATNKSKEFR